MNSEERVVVVLLGAPGAGKGTHAAIVFAWLGVPHISTGQMLRAEIAQRTDMGKRIRNLVESGVFVDDQIIDSLISKRIRQADCRQGFILDGYPRNIRQVLALDNELRPNDRLIVIDIAVDPAGIIERLKRRRRCDDREDLVRSRFEIYRRETIPVAEIYRKRGICHSVDGMKPCAQVSENIAAILRSQLDSREIQVENRT